jgi:hypothetical protein
MIHYAVAHEKLQRIEKKRINLVKQYCRDAFLFGVTVLPAGTKTRPHVKHTHSIEHSFLSQFVVAYSFLS